MKKSIISRTISHNIVKGLSVDVATRTVTEYRDSVPSKYDTCEKALAFVRKTVPTVVAIEKVEKVEQLVGMYESDFIANAEPFDSRTKETRGMVTKECITRSAVCMVVDKDRNVIDATYVGAYDEKTARKAAADDGKMFVQLVRVNESKKLYAMTSEKFELLAKPMKDRFTLA